MTIWWFLVHLWDKYSQVFPWFICKHYLAWRILLFNLYFQVQWYLFKDLKVIWHIFIHCFLKIILCCDNLIEPEHEHLHFLGSTPQHLIRVCLNDIFISYIPMDLLIFEIICNLHIPVYWCFISNILCSWSWVSC